MSVQVELTVTTGRTHLPVVKVSRYTGVVMAVVAYTAPVVVGPTVIALGLDTDGVYYYLPGSAVGIDVDGVPYFTATPAAGAKPVLLDVDSVPYFTA